MPSLLGTTVAANYGTMKSPESYTVDASNVRTYTGPFTQFGTRQLKFLKVTAVTGDTGSTSAVNFSTTYTAAFSNFAKAVRAIQQVAEIYAVGTPDSTGFIAVVAADTANGAETSSNVQATTYGQLEAYIAAACATGTGAAATVSELDFDGVAIS
jgi:hypothetical protein